MQSFLNPTLYARSPGEWAHRLAAIPDARVRIVCARIAWWDWFSFRPVDERWPELDWSVEAYHDLLLGRPHPDPEDVRLALVGLGYRRSDARRRARVRV